MAYLGQIFESNPLGEGIWWISRIPAEVLGEIIGQYATYGGYIYIG